MMDIMEIGPAPCNEDCAQLGEEGYREKALAECRRFIKLIRDRFGEEPLGCRDFGTYYEAACMYDLENAEASQYAYRCETGAPATWD